MSVRAKFLCTDITKGDDGSGPVKLLPVTTGSAENETFYKYTPSGRIEMSTVNAAALSQFEAGKEYYVDFTPAESK